MYLVYYKVTNQTLLYEDIYIKDIDSIPVRSKIKRSFFLWLL